MLVYFRNVLIQVRVLHSEKLFLTDKIWVILNLCYFSNVTKGHFWSVWSLNPQGPQVFVCPRQADRDFRQVRTWAAVSQTPVFLS